VEIITICVNLRKYKLTSIRYGKETVPEDGKWESEHKAAREVREREIERLPEDLSFYERAVFEAERETHQYMEKEQRDSCDWGNMRL
jgi:hypothetical protein